MLRGDDLASGLSLERTESSGSQQQIDATAWNNADTPGFSAYISPEEIKSVSAIAVGSAYERAERFEANHLLGLYYSDLDDLKRASYHIQLALTFADTHGQRAGCYMNMLFCQLLIEERKQLQVEDLTLYDKYVEESLRGIQANEAAAILGALDYSEQWEDYGLTAAAALAWSTHPENTEAFERESAEAAYHHYKKLFEQQVEASSSALVYTPLAGEPKGKASSRVRVRLEFLRNRTVYTLEELMQSKRESTPTPASVSQEQKRADELMARVDAFARKYPKGARSLYSAKPAVMQEYMNLTVKLVSELRVNNGPLMRALIQDFEVFEDMQDYMLLGCAATLWLIHPENKDGRDKITTQKRSELWMETSISLSEQFHDMQPLEYRMKELNMSERYTYQHDWMELAQYVNQMVSRSV